MVKIPDSSLEFIDILLHLLIALLGISFFLFLLHGFVESFREGIDQKEYEKQAMSLLNDNFEVIFVKKENIKIDKDTNTLFYVDISIGEEKQNPTNEPGVKMWSLTYKEKNPIEQMFNVPEKCQGKKIVIEFHEFSLSDESKYVIGASCS